MSRQFSKEVIKSIDWLAEGLVDEFIDETSILSNQLDVSLPVIQSAVLTAFKAQLAQRSNENEDDNG